MPRPLRPGLDKERFYIFDAVNIYDDLQDVSDMHPVATRPYMTFTQLAQELRDVEDEVFRNMVQGEILVKLRRKRLTDQQTDDLIARTGMDRRQLLGHRRHSNPRDIGQWFARHPEVVDILDEVH